MTTRSNEPTYNQKVRLSAMREIHRNKDKKQMQAIKELLFAKNQENFSIRYYTNSQHHSFKLRLAQAFAFLFRMDPAWDERILKMTLVEANQSNVTHIHELIIGAIVDPADLIHIIENVIDWPYTSFWSFYNHLLCSTTMIFFNFFFWRRSKATKASSQCSWSCTTCAAESPRTANT